MTNERYNQLMWEGKGELTEEEKAEGWHFCREWDGLLIGPGDDEREACSCLPKKHPVYKTVPPNPYSD